MAVVEPYSPCPCGSGEKFKWCCQKIETYAERAKRLFEGGQFAAAISALDEGLKKEPNNAWLLTRKALYLVQKNEPAEAKTLLRRVVRKQPKHFGAHFLLTRLVLETEGPVEGAALLQESLAAFDRGERGPLAKLAELVGAFLAETGHYPAALKHLMLERQLGADAESMSGSVVRMIDTDPSIPPWLKDTYQLSSPPEGTTDVVRSRFLEAHELAAQGLWSSAAVAFHELSNDPNAGAEAFRNVGICRLWLAEDAAAADGIRRYLDRTGPTAEAVDLAALYQLIAPTSPDDQVEQVQWIWPLRDREALLSALRGAAEYREEGKGPIDPEDPDSPEVDQFSMLDRPLVEARPGLKAGELARFVGRLLVGQEIVALESFDDGRLDALAGRFRGLAGPSVAPAHPKTKVLGTIPRDSLALSWELVLPDGLDRDEVRRIRGEQRQILLTDVWPATPLPYLGGRTPLEAASAGDAEVMLRAAVFRLELADPGQDDVDFGALRARLNIGPEPAVDPQTVELAGLHPSRLGLVPVDGLDDDRLVELYMRAKSLMQLTPVEHAARALIGRPEAYAKVGLTAITLYSDLVVIVSSKGNVAEAFDWLRKGRQADPSAVRAQNAPVWDMLEIRLRSGTQPPEVWVPELAVVLDRYRDDPTASQKLILSLIDMGLVRMVRNPGDPEDVMIDPSILEAMLARYGPRVTTASGQLGVAATRGEIWTPGSQAGGGAIWTPGSGPATPSTGRRPASGAEAPRLIIPGR